MFTLAFGIGEFFVGIVGALFRTVASAYDLIIAVANSININNELIEPLYQNLYMLVGIFMLFRIAISLLNMLINPDKVSDKKSGAGNLFMRIFISLGLLIAMPFIFNFTLGVQNALVNEDGLLYRLFPLEDIGSTNNLASLNVLDNVETVNAAENLTCYYGYSGDTSWNLTNKKDQNQKYAAAFAFEFYKAEQCAHRIYDTEMVSGEEVEKESEWCVRVKTGKVDPDDYLEFSNITFNKKIYFSGDDEFDGTSCPLAIDGVWCQAFTGDGNTAQNLICWGGTLNPRGDAYSEFERFNFETTFSNNYSIVSDDYESFKEDFVRRLVNYNEDDLNTWIGEGAFSQMADQAGLVGECIDFMDSNKDNRASAQALRFANSAARLMIDLKDHSPTDEVKNSGLFNWFSDGTTYGEARNCFIYGSKADRDIGKAYDQGEIDVNVIFSIVVAIIMLFLLFSIAIDVALRNFKLLFLQVIAPIPILSRINPEDKIFDTYLKQYIGTYVDLFIKIIVINAGLYMLYLFSEVDVPDLGFFGNLVIILGGLLFIKTMPSFVSKIFGIQDAAGSFKDSIKMAKAAVGVGAGVAIGGALLAPNAVRSFRATKGQSTGNRLAAVAHSLGSGAFSTVKNLKNNAKGTISGSLATGKDSWSKTSANVAKYQSGIAAGALLGNTMTMNLLNRSRQDERVEAAYEDILKRRKTMDDQVKGEILKGKDRYRLHNLTGAAAELNGLSMQQVHGLIESNKDIYGWDLSPEKISAYKKAYADGMNNASAMYVRDVRTGVIDDIQGKMFMENYDMGVQHYQQVFGTKDAPAKDPHYKYDFNQFISTDEIVHSRLTGDDFGKLYKNTKSFVDKQSAEFSNSSTRVSHYKADQSKNK